MGKSFLKGDVRHNGVILNKGSECPEEHVAALAAQGLLEVREDAASSEEEGDEAPAKGKKPAGKKPATAASE